MRCHSLARVTLAGAALAAAAACWGQESKPAPPDCSAGSFRQFDFWVGEWDVFLPDGSPAGENRIQAVAGGCALFESWRGSKGGSGNSLNYFAVDDGRWHQIWIDSRAGRLDLTGGIEGGSMVLSATSPNRKKPKVTVTQRITWTPNADGSVRQHWQTSEDGGTTWETVFDGRYVRKKGSSSSP